jgi:hypothetical protein
MNVPSAAAIAADLLGLALVAASVIATGAPSPAPARDGAPVLVELFTSQGCSSCPPAEAMLSALAHDGSAGGRPVIALAYHVDYWNDLGWVDPSSSPAWSERQQRYASARGDQRVYTPQLVVAGDRHVVGSQRAAVDAAVAAAPTQVALAATATRAGTELRARATAPAGAEVWLAVWEDGVTTAIARGENAGRRQREDRVVRRLVRVGAGEVRVALDPRWSRGGATAFAQRPDSLAIVGATDVARW